MLKIFPETVICADRLELRELSLGLSSAMLGHLTANVTRSLEIFPLASVLEQRAAIRELRRQTSRLEAWQAGIFLRETNEYVGNCGVVAYDEESGSAEIGYWLAESFQWKWLATEAVRAIAHHLFDICDANRVVICTDARNTASRSVAERVGFKLDGILRSHAEIKGELVDLAYYTLFPGELR